MSSKLEVAPQCESNTSAEKSDKKSVAAPSKKNFLTAAEVRSLPREEIVVRYGEVEKYLASQDEKLSGLSSSELDEKLKLQQQESTRRENVLVMRLATKEQEMQELVAQIHELKQAQTPATSQLKSTLLDPSVNLLFEKMKTELGETKEKLEQAQNDLSAWKFTPDSVTGKKLMAKCRMLIAENQDLGKQLSQGRIAQLEAELALQKKYNEELKCSQDELNDFVLQLDEEVEGMESTICALQQQLKETKQKYQNSIEEMEQLRTILDRTKDSQNALKRTYEPMQNEGMDVEKKRPNDTFKVIELPGLGETDDGIRTQTNIDEEVRLKGRSPIKTGCKNAFSITNILSGEENATEDNPEEDFDMARTRKEHTNGEMYDS